MSDEFVTYEGVKYRKVKRKAQKGDKLYLYTRRGRRTHYFSNVPLIVTAESDLDSNNEICVHGIDEAGRELSQYISDDQFYVVEPVADDSDIIIVDGVKYRKVDRDPRIGDYVYIQTDERRLLTKGKVYEIVEIDEDGDGIFYDNDGDITHFCGNDDNFQLVERIPSTTADIERELAELKAKIDVLEAQLAEKQAEERPKIGDYVHVVKNRGSHFAKVGDVLRVWDIVGTQIRCEMLDGTRKRNDYFYDDELEKITPKEAAKHEEVTKWAKIGRKPGYFKAGDIVRYRYTSDNGNAIGIDGYSGIIAEIEKVGTSSIKLIKPEFVKHRNGTWAKKYELELIAPVESVVNLRVSE